MQTRDRKAKPPDVLVLQICDVRLLEPTVSSKMLLRCIFVKITAMIFLVSPLW
jgi:hypothetical protein